MDPQPTSLILACANKKLRKFLHIIQFLAEGGYSDNQNSTSAEHAHQLELTELADNVVKVIRPESKTQLSNESLLAITKSVPICSLEDILADKPNIMRLITKENVVENFSECVKDLLAAIAARPLPAINTPTVPEPSGTIAPATPENVVQPIVIKVSNEILMINTTHQLLIEYEFMKVPIVSSTREVVNETPRASDGIPHVPISYVPFPARPTPTAQFFPVNTSFGVLQNCVSNGVSSFQTADGIQLSSSHSASRPSPLPQSVAVTDYLQNSSPVSEQKTSSATLPSAKTEIEVKKKEASEITATEFYGIAKIFEAKSPTTSPLSPVTQKPNDLEELDNSPTKSNPVFEQQSSSPIHPSANGASPPTKDGETVAMIEVKSPMTSPQLPVAQKPSDLEKMDNPLVTTNPVSEQQYSSPTHSSANGALWITPTNNDGTVELKVSATSPQFPVAQKPSDLKKMDNRLATSIPVSEQQSSSPTHSSATEASAVSTSEDASPTTSPQSLTPTTSYLEEIINPPNKALIETIKCTSEQTLSSQILQQSSPSQSFSTNSTPDKNTKSIRVDTSPFSFPNIFKKMGDEKVYLLPNERLSTDSMKSSPPSLTSPVLNRRPSTMMRFRKSYTSYSEEAEEELPSSKKRNQKIKKSQKGIPTSSPSPNLPVPLDNVRKRKTSYEMFFSSNTTLRFTRAELSMSSNSRLRSGTKRATTPVQENKTIKKIKLAEDDPAYYNELGRDMETHSLLRVTRSQSAVGKNSGPSNSGRLNHHKSFSSLPKEASKKEKKDDQLEDSELCSNKKMCMIAKCTDDNIYWVKCDECDRWMHTFCVFTLNYEHPETETYKCMDLNRKSCIAKPVESDSDHSVEL